jgi:Bifunctional DNA primase/polymerase, N-terminal
MSNAKQSCAACDILGVACDECKPMVEHALALAAMEFRVFPLGTWNDPGPNATPEQLKAAIDAAKAPRPGFTEWPKNATSDPEKIKAMWRFSPRANIGVVTTFNPVVDVDTRHGGHETVAAMPAEWRADLERTLTARTWSGGFHHFFRLPKNGVLLKGGTGKLGKGVDLKADRGYVVGVGSIVGGKRYAWVQR